MMQRVCVDRLPEGGRVTVFGDRESGAMRPQEKQRPVAHTWFDLRRRDSERVQW